MDALGGEVDCSSCPFFFSKKSLAPVSTNQCKTDTKKRGIFSMRYKNRGVLNFQFRGWRKSTVCVFRAGADDAILEVNLYWSCSQK